MEPLANVIKSMKQWNAEEAAGPIRDLLNDPLIVEWRARYPDLDDEMLKRNANRLYQYMHEYAHCSQCPGLDACPNDFRGHYTKLTAEVHDHGSYIYDHKVMCLKLKARRSEQALRRRVRSFYVDDKALSDGYALDEILAKDRVRSKAVKQIVDYIVQTGESGLQAKGLYLWGPFGTGKTFLMCYLLHELAKAGFTGVIVYMPDFVEDLKDMFSEPGKLKETIELLKHTDLLVFDDLGAENLNPWVRDHVVGTILNYRMNRKPTFYTSNYDLSGLGRHFSFTHKDGVEEYKGRRIMDRIQPFVTPVEVNGANQRGS